MNSAGPDGDTTERKRLKRCYLSVAARKIRAHYYARSSIISTLSVI
jgi:hypothetical protein